MNRRFSTLLWICLCSSALTGGSSCVAAAAHAPVQMWAQRYDGPANRDDSPRGIAVDAAGNVAVTGHSFNSPDDIDYGTAKYAAKDGALLWEKRYDGFFHNDDYADAIAMDAEGNVIVTGYSSTQDSPYVFHTIKYSAANGEIVWERRFQHPSGATGGGVAVAVDPSGDIVVTGSTGDGTNDGIYTAKYAGSDGALIWDHIYNGPANGDDYATALAVDTSGNIAVVGQGYSTETETTDSYTLKYSGTNGALLWDRRYAGAVNPHIYPKSVAVDAMGNVVVAGLAYPLGGASDYYTAKYSSTDGALLWQKQYDGPQSRTDQALAVAIDKDGNAVVTGYSMNISGRRDFYTAKYAAADGSLLWEHRYDGPLHLDDTATSVAIDRDNNVVVAGHSSNGTNDDFCLLKYSGVDGFLVWEGRYNGPENGGDTMLSPRCLALCTNGNVAITGTSQGSNRVDYATVVYRDPSPNITSLQYSNGVSILGVAGLPRFEYGVEASTNLSHWNLIGMQTSGTNGFFQFTDPNAGERKQKFYRIRNP